MFSERFTISFGIWYQNKFHDFRGVFGNLINTYAEPKRLTIFAKKDSIIDTARKVSVFGVFLVRIFLDSDWIQRGAKHISVFSLNPGKYGPETLRVRTLFMQWDILQGPKYSFFKLLGPGHYTIKNPELPGGNLVTKEERFKSIKDNVPGPGTYQVSFFNLAFGISFLNATKYISTVRKRITP